MIKRGRHDSFHDFPQMSLSLDKGYKKERSCYAISPFSMMLASGVNVPNSVWVKQMVTFPLFKEITFQTWYISIIPVKERFERRRSIISP